MESNNRDHAACDTETGSNASWMDEAKQRLNRLNS